MKKLLLMRHAKSDWSDDSLEDFDRPLNKRGLKAAPKMGEELKKRKIIPDLILSSPAERAKKTAALFAEANGYKNEIQYIDNFYFGIEDDVIRTIKEVDNNVQTLLVIAHNPTMEVISSQLTIDNEVVPFKTATVAILNFYAKKWSGLQMNSCEVEAVLNPKEL